jgi:hypothetical protein
MRARTRLNSSRGSHATLPRPLTQAFATWHRRHRSIKLANHGPIRPNRTETVPWMKGNRRSSRSMPAWPS